MVHGSGQNELISAIHIRGPKGKISIRKEATTKVILAKIGVRGGRALGR